MCLYCSHMTAAVLRLTGTVKEGGQGCPAGMCVPVIRLRH